MRALFIEHDHVSPPGLVGDRLEQRGFEIVEHLVVDEEHFESPDVTTDFPEPGEFDLLIPMGAPWSAYDHHLIGSWVLPELDLLRKADAAGVPVLGICFGGQLLAMAHGGDVVEASGPEFGWVSVDTDYPDLLPEGPWFQWHSDRFIVPPGAEELARSQVAPQAFLLRRNLGLQFHPELTAAGLLGWISQGGEKALIAHGLDPEEIYQSMVMHEQQARERTTRLVDAFLDHCVFV